MGRMDWDSNPGGREIFLVPLHKPHPATCTMGTSSLSQGVRWLRHFVDHPPQSGTEVKQG
jgi:hypothetical protein